MVRLPLLVRTKVVARKGGAPVYAKEALQGIADATPEADRAQHARLLWRKFSQAFHFQEACGT